MESRQSGENALRRLPSLPWSPIGKNNPFERESAPSLPIDGRLSARFCRVEVRNHARELCTRRSTVGVQIEGYSPPYKSEKLAKSCTSVATSAEQAELFRVVREGHAIPESTCWTSPIVIQPVEKRPFWSNGKKHVFLWKLAPAQGKDWAKGYPNLSPILPFSLPVILHLWQHAFLVFGEEFPGRKNKSS